MHDTSVKMRDGRVLCGPIWEWRPEKGFFTIMDENGGDPIRIELEGVESAVTPGQRVGPGVEADRDELARARRDGWKP